MMINKILRSVSITLLVSVVFSISPASIASGETDNENFTPEQSVAETNLRTPGLEEILLNQVPQEIRDEISKAKETNPLEVLRRKIGDFSNNAKTDNRFGDQVTSPVLETSEPNNNGEFSEWQGTLKAIQEGGRAYYFLVTPAYTYDLDYDEEIPGNFLGKTVRVIGTVTGTKIRAISIVVVGPGAAPFQPITAGVQRTAVLALRYSNIAQEPMTTVNLGNMIFGPFPTVETLWEENSYNNLIVQNIGVHGWWALPNTQAFYNPNCPPPQTGTCPLFTNLVNDAIAVANTNGIQFQNNDRLILFFNGSVGTAAGWGLDYATFQAPYGPVILSISWMPWPNGYTLAPNGHEYGHQLGFDHSGNVYTPYDSPWDIMSNAWGAGAACTNQGQHTIVNNKAFSASWLSGTSVAMTSNTGILEATVYPTTRTSGLRAIKITTPNPNVYYTVEVRRQENHDSCLPSSGVIIHKVDNTLGDWQAKPIDSTPGDGTLNNSEWNVGQMYFDQDYDFRIHVVSNQPNDGKLIRVEPFQINWGQDTPLTSSGGNGNPSLARDASNNIHIVWSNNSAEIYYTKLDNNGNTLVDDLPLTINTPGFSVDPDIAIDSQDNLHIVWADERDNNQGPEIYYTKLDNNGNTLVNDLRLTFAFWNSFRPALAIDPSDNIHIAWNDDRASSWSTGIRELYYTKLDNNGNTLIDDVGQYGNVSEFAGIVVDSNGNVHLTWTWYPWWTSTPNAILYKKLDNNGNTLVYPISIINGYFSTYPKMAIDTNDNVHIVWNDRRDLTDEIYYTKLSNNGITMVDDLRLTFTGGTAGPDLTIDQDNNIHIVWWWWGDNEIYYKQLNNNGSSLSSNFRLTFTSGGSQYPSIDLDANNNIHLAWEEWTSGGPEIYYKRSLPLQSTLTQGSPNVGSQISINLADPVNYNGQYFLVMSATTTPGITLPNGMVIPLNFDGVFLLSLFYPNLIGLNNSQGILNLGQATATWNIPNIPGLAGMTVYLALVTLDVSGQVAGISQPVPVTLLP